MFEDVFFSLLTCFRICFVYSLVPDFLPNIIKRDEGNSEITVGIALISVSSSFSGINRPLQRIIFLCLGILSRSRALNFGIMR